MEEKIFVCVDGSIFNQLIGYTIGDVQETEEETIVRFDKRVDNVFISREVIFDDDGIHICDDYILDIIPRED